MDTSHSDVDKAVDKAEHKFGDAARHVTEAGTDAFASVQDANRDELFSNAHARSNIRARVDKEELNLAMRDLSEGTRGMIRVAPFTAVVVGIALGMMVGRRRSKARRAPATRRR